MTHKFMTHINFIELMFADYVVILITLYTLLNRQNRRIKNTICFTGQKYRCLLFCNDSAEELQILLIMKLLRLFWSAHNNSWKAFIAAELQNESLTAPSPRYCWPWKCWDFLDQLRTTIEMNLLLKNCRMSSWQSLPLKSVIPGLHKNSS